MGNGRKGRIGYSPQSIYSYPADLVLDTNEERSVQEHNPDLLAFADNGGGELFLFNTAEPQPSPEVSELVQQVKPLLNGSDCCVVE